ncbi:MAG TPA: Uma2 family endonuclease [Gemmatimonadales bacterium]|nr:Uma2 family endonuclease [Gemmatimonadales bacterium]
MVRALPDDGKRYEVVEGELLVTPSPRSDHQRAVGKLYYAFTGYLEAVGGAEALFSPADIEFDSRTLVQPDLFVVPLPDGRKFHSWRDITTLLLAIEVLSPSTARQDRLTKRRLYQRRGIEYWIVDLDARLVERWRQGDERPEIVTSLLEWKLPEVTDTVAIDLESFFLEVLE